MNRYIFLMIAFFGLNFDSLRGSNLILCKSYAEIQNMAPNFDIENIDRFIRPYFAVDKKKFESIDKNNAYFVNMFGCEIKNFKEVKARLDDIGINHRSVVALNVSNNDIEKITLEDMREFENLQFFSAYNNEIENIDSNAFYNTKISMLMLSNNKLTELSFFNKILFSQRSFLFE